MTKRRQVLTVEDAKPATRQHRTPCSDCPWSRKAVAGWLGPLSADEWLKVAVGEGQAECHTKTGAQCAGLTIFRANICKSLRDREAFRLERNTKKVFATPSEFMEHHEKVKR